MEVNGNLEVEWEVAVVAGFEIGKKRRQEPDESNESGQARIFC